MLQGHLVFVVLMLDDRWIGMFFFDFNTREKQFEIFRWVHTSIYRSIDMMFQKKRQFGAKLYTVAVGSFGGLLGF